MPSRSCQTDLVTPAERGQLVATLMAVPGVASAAVDDDAGGPGVLRLELVTGADEVSVASEVNAVLRDRFGLAVDPTGVRVVSGGTAFTAPTVNGEAVNQEVVTPEPVERDAVHRDPADPDPVDPDPVDHEATEAADGEGSPRRSAAGSRRRPPLPQGRLTIERVGLSSSGLVTTVVVTLSADGRQLEGTAEGTATSDSLNRALACATLRAVEAAAGSTVRFELEHVELASTPGGQTALAVVTMVTERSTQRLSGASVVREDLRQAVIRAVLAAINRQVAPLIFADEFLG